MERDDPESTATIARFEQHAKQRGERFSIDEGKKMD
jgi:hypothetical protein